MEKYFNKAATWVAHVTGKPATFIACLTLIVVWGVSGPFFDYSETWQLIINTSTTIITFLMVFLIQNTQNRDSAAIQTKLDEIIRVGIGKNEFIGIERLTEEEVEEFRKKCEAAAKKDDQQKKQSARSKKASA